MDPVCPNLGWVFFRGILSSPKMDQIHRMDTQRGPESANICALNQFETTTVGCFRLILAASDKGENHGTGPKDFSGIMHQKGPLMLHKTALRGVAGVADNGELLRASGKAPRLPPAGSRPLLLLTLSFRGSGVFTSVEGLLEDDESFRATSGCWSRARHCAARSSLLLPVRLDKPARTRLSGSGLAEFLGSCACAAIAPSAAEWAEGRWAAPSHGASAAPRAAGPLPSFVWKRCPKRTSSITSSSSSEMFHASDVKHWGRDCTVGQRN